jgi:hypothetical protein
MAENAQLERDLDTVSTPEAVEFIAESGGIVAPAGPPTIIETPIEWVTATEVEPEKTPEPPLQTVEKVANVANQEWPASLRKYKDPEKRRKYMANLMKKRRAKLKKAKKGKK